MANVSRAMGSRPVSNTSGAAYTGKVNAYRINANSSAAVGVGSIVALSGAADDGNEGLPVVVKFAGELDGSGAGTGAGSVPVGIVVGFKIDPTVKGDLPIYNPASTSRIVYVADDPAVMFVIQEDSNGGQLAAASIGLNAALTADTPSTTTGKSNQELDTSTVGTSGSLPIKIIAFLRAVDNEVSSSYAKVICKFTKHAYATGGTASALNQVGV